MRVACLCIVVFCLVSACSTTPEVEVVAVDPLTESSSITITPDQVDCGAVSQCELLPPIKVVIRNPLATPVRIRGFVATCGCTIPDLQPNLELPPGGEVTVKVRLELWGQGRKQQFIRFIDENSRPLGRLQVRYEVRSSVRSTPSGISREVNPDGSFQVESSDDVPFAITHSYPPVVAKRSDERATDHSLSIDWAKVDALAIAESPLPEFEFDQAGAWSTLLLRIGTDKPDCSELFIWLRNTPPARAVTH